MCNFAKNNIYIAENMSILELSEQEIVRRNSLAEMRKLGIDPYPAAEYVVTGYTLLPGQTSLISY